MIKSISRPLYRGLFWVSVVLLTLLSGGCASSYRSIHPPSLPFANNPGTQEEISVLYRYDVMREAGNKKYAKKELNKGVRVVALKITNNTSTPVVLGQDAVFYCGSVALTPLNPLVIKNSLKQHPAAHLLYLPLTLLRLNVYSGYSATSYPIGYGIGPGLAFGNMLMASAANTKMTNELMQYNLIGKSVQPGETVYGLLGMTTSTGVGHITIKVAR